MTTCCIMDQGLNTIRETGRPSILLWTTYQPHTNHILHTCTDPLLTTHQLTIITDHIQLYQPHTDHLPTTYRPHTNKIQTTYQLHTNHIPTTYRPCYQPCYLQSHTDQVPEPHTDHVTDPMLTTNTNHILLHTDPLLTTYCQCPHTKHIPTIYLLLTNMLPTTYQPLFLVQFVFIITKFNGYGYAMFYQSVEWKDVTWAEDSISFWAFFEETPLPYKLEY